MVIKFTEYKGQSPSRKHNSSYPKGGVFRLWRDKLCSKDSFVVYQTLVFQIKFCGKSPALQVAANRDRPKKKNPIK